VAAPAPVAAPTADTTPAASTPPAAPAPAKVPQTPADAPVRPSAAKADVVVTDMASPYPVNATVGQTIGIVSPGGDSIWQVDFPPDELTLLTPMDKLSSPGTLGWVWRAAKAGDIEIVLTARAPCPNPPCGENPARYPVTVHIKPRQ
jgi:hypothetical protein